MRELPFLGGSLQHRDGHHERAQRTSQIVGDEREVLLSLLLEEPQVRDVAKDDDCQRDLSARVSHARPRGGEPAPLSVQTHPQDLVVHELLASQRARERPIVAVEGALLEIVRLSRVDLIDPAQLRISESEDHARRLVDHHDAAAPVDDRDPLAQVLEERVELRALLRLGLGALLLSNAGQHEPLVERAAKLLAVQAEALPLALHSTVLDRAFHAPEHLFVLQRLDEVVVQARAQADEHRLSFVERRHQDDGKVGVDLVQALAQRHTVHLRHAQIREDDVGRREPGCGERRLAVLGARHREPVPPQQDREPPARFVVVIDHEDPRWRRALARPRHLARRSSRVSYCPRHSPPLFARTRPPTDREYFPF